MRELCVKCQAQYQVRKLGVTVIETSGNPPEPARLWAADLLACPICNSEIVTHFSHNPILEMRDAGFEQKVRKARDSKALIMHHPEFLAMQVRSDTVHVRSYGHK